MSHLTISDRFALVVVAGAHDALLRHVPGVVRVLVLRRAVLEGHGGDLHELKIGREVWRVCKGVKK